MTLLFAAVTVLGCSKSILPDSAEQVSHVQDALDEVLTDSDRVVFRSWNGEWIGMDCDSEIELHANGKAVLTEFGLGVSKYYGTYSITAAADGNASELTLSLEEYDGKWPVMAVYKDQSDLLLIPTEGSTDFLVGNRGGATVPGDAGSFWPFRQIPMPMRYGKTEGKTVVSGKAPG